MASPDIFESHNRLLFRVLMTDSHVGLTFANLAAEADPGSDKRIRNQANARKAYDTVLTISRRTEMSDAEWRELTASLDELKHALERLGEQFSRP